MRRRARRDLRPLLAGAALGPMGPTTDDRCPSCGHALSEQR